jgi:tryptophan 2,3-dioxygenase
VAKGTDYSTYLRIHDLLKLQIPLTEDAPDELLFIVVHQSYELWFKVIIDELRAPRGAARQRTVERDLASASHDHRRGPAALAPAGARFDVARGFPRVP